MFRFLKKMKLKKTDKFFLKRNIINLIGILLSVIIVILAFLTFELVKKQTDYVEIQSIPERINQLKARQRAIEYCRQSPDSNDSGLVNMTTGEPVSCSDVLDRYNQ